jgi:hypothetical protein
MILSSSLIVFPLLFAGFVLTGEFTLLDDPTDVSEVIVIAGFPADGPEFIGFERWIEPRDPMRKLKLLIVRSIS